MKSFIFASILTSLALANNATIVNSAAEFKKLDYKLCQKIEMQSKMKKIKSVAEFKKIDYEFCKKFFNKKSN